MTATEAYQNTDVRKTFHAVVRAFSRRYGRPREDVLSEANEYFMGAYLDYDPARCGKFALWVRVRVWGRLLDAMRKEEYRKARMRKAATNIDLMVVQLIPDFDPQMLCNKLTQDGKFVVRMVINMPVSLRLVLVQMAGDTPSEWREAVKQVLREHGWSWVRIRAAFKDVRTNL